MSPREFSQVARLIFGALCYVAIVGVAVWMLGGEAWKLIAVVAVLVAATASPFLGAGVVWFVVRRANRRDDSQPADPPV